MLKKGEREEERRRWWWWWGELISGKFKWSDEKKLEGRAGADKTGFRVGERERKRGGEKCYFKHRGERERERGRWKYHPNLNPDLYLVSEDRCR